MKKSAENELKLIPRAENYIEYILQVLFKLPRVEKFSIGNEYKQSMYEMLRNIMYLNRIKVDNKEYFMTLNKIETELNTQRIYLRIMKSNKWIDEKKFKISMELIYELGKMVGGLYKYYAKNSEK